MPILVSTFFVNSWLFGGTQPPYGQTYTEYLPIILLFVCNLK